MLHDDFLEGLQAMLLHVGLGRGQFLHFKKVRLLAADVEVRRTVKHIAHFTDKRVEVLVDVVVDDVQDLRPGEQLRHGPAHGFAVVGCGQFRHERHAARVSEGDEVF